MLESGIDRIISQVVDPKINHTFRPQVEKAVHEFLATLNHKEEAGSSAVPADEKPDSSVIIQGALCLLLVSSITFLLELSVRLGYLVLYSVSLFGCSSEIIFTLNISQVSQLVQHFFF